MELWIRSQDREILAKAEHLDVYNASVENEELFVIEESGTDLGSYKTKEKALEVLEEIQNKIKLMGKTYEIGTMQDERLFPHQFNYVDNVYEMPKE